MPASVMSVFVDFETFEFPKSAPEDREMIVRDGGLIQDQFSQVVERLGAMQRVFDCLGVTYTTKIDGVDYGKLVEYPAANAG